MIYLLIAANYNPKSEDAYTFFKIVQNKLHYAITSNTAAEKEYEKFRVIQDQKYISSMDEFYNKYLNESKGEK